VASPAREHAGEHHPGEQQRRGEVHLHDPLQLLRLRRREGSESLEAGVVDQQFHGVEPGLDLLDDPSRRVGFGEVGRDDERPAATLLHLAGDRCERVRVPGHERDVRAAVGQGQRGVPAEATRRARHDGGS
jgi:hypothetical protein